MYVTPENVVQDVNRAFGSVLAHGADALTTRVRDLDAEATTLLAFTDRKQQDDILCSIINPPTPKLQLASTFHALQEWEGYVREIGVADFVARLIDLTAGSIHEAEEADIPLDEISFEDRARMRPGSIFRWVIGYEKIVATGTRKRVSQIVFRDPPVMARTDLSDGEAWAREVILSLNL